MRNKDFPYSVNTAVLTDRVWFTLIPDFQG